MPLSFMQEQIWLRVQLAPTVPLYNETLVLQRSGALDREILEGSIRELVRRHQALRTRIVISDGIPAQLIADDASVELSFAELHVSHSREHGKVLDEVRKEAQRLFDLTRAPLMRLLVLSLSGDKYLIVVTVHTVIADAQSLNILAQELVSFYEAYANRAPVPLADLRMAYADCVRLQRAPSQDDVLERQVSYWRQHLADIPPSLELPADRPRSPVPTFRGAHQYLIIAHELSQSLKKLCDAERVPVFVSLLAAFQVLLSRYTGQGDIVTGMIVPGRCAAGSEDLIGQFGNVVVARTDLNEDCTFRRLLSRVSDIVRAACEHQNVPFDRIATDLQRHKQEPGQNSLFQVLFSMAPAVSLSQSGWEVAKLAVHTGTAKVDLELELWDEPTCMEARFTYNADLFGAATIRRMVGHYQTLLRGIAANPGQSHSLFSLLSDAERDQLLIEWNNTQAQYRKDHCIHQLFELQVDRTPHDAAVVFENESLTYGELHARSNQLASYLVKLGIAPEALIGICVERSLDMVVGLLGILKAGAAYVPLDPAYPNERLAFMLEDAEVALLLTQSALAKRLPQTGAKILHLDTGWHEIEQESAENVASRVKPENLAYVIYTSGSTGKPKGVQIEHRAAVNFLSSMMQRPGITSDDRLLAITTLSFDIAGLEIFLPLSVGACLDLVSRDVASDGKRLLSKLANSGATILQATPATWRMLLEAGWEGSHGLKALCGGEAWSRSLADQLLQRTASLWNMYGPTETTVWSTVAKVERGNDGLTIGRPIANTEIFILDKQLQPVPIGIAGELYIGGDGLARGYLKRPELTAEKFITCAVKQGKQARLYRTGDLARYVDTGNVQFLGRIDHQVKIRGFRVEVGEIEAALRRYHAVKETIVVAREDASGEQRLVAYFVPDSEAIPRASDLRGFLRETLPEHMIPSAFTAVPVMPLTPNGKIDRRALPAPEQSNLATTDDFAVPRDLIEGRLVTLWESVLGMRPIGIRDNFFEVGGHSLLAVKLMYGIERAFGNTLPISTLFQAPTVEQLAALLRRDGWSSPWSSLVPIQTGGSKPPFFCIHGIEANVIRFYALAKYLGPDQPVYALQAQGVNDNCECHTRAEDMAAHYLKEIRTVYPKGPYYLGGYSFGGMIALEMAQQLLAQGEDLPSVVLFDTFCAPMGGTLSSRNITSIWAALLTCFRIPASERRTYFTRLANAPVRASRRWLHVLRLPRRIKKARKACLKAVADYVPQGYPGRMILFRSTYKPLDQTTNPHAAWNTYALNGLESFEIEGNHENILLEPQVRAVAKQLKKCLDEARHSHSDPESAPFVEKLVH